MQILREINFDESNMGKNAILTIVDGLNFNFGTTLGQFCRAEIFYFQNSKQPKMSKWQFLTNLN